MRTNRARALEQVEQHLAEEALAEKLRTVRETFRDQTDTWTAEKARLKALNRELAAQIHACRAANAEAQRAAERVARGQQRNAALLGKQLPEAEAHNVLLQRQHVASQGRIQALEAALMASRERRASLLEALRLMVAAEDTEGLSDELYDKLLDAALRRARTALSLERVKQSGEIISVEEK